MRWLRSAMAVILCGAAVALPCAAQSKDMTAPKPAAGATQQSAAIPLNADLTVQGNVTAQAVLIPRKIAKAVFGGKIANEYAVVQVTINNKSSDAALIVQGAYLDYSKWALAGGGISSQQCSEENATDPKSKFAACTKSAEVASEEYRVVRGQALNAQTWTWRNGVVRGLVLAGTLATGLSFTTSEQKYSQAVAAFNGDLVPGVGTFWPDQTVGQLNRISDLGYRTNKVISKQGSDVIVCFFPIDRFLTKGFKNLFLSQPALFFAPYQMLVDKKVQSAVSKAVPQSFFGSNVDLKTMSGALPCYLKITGLEREILGDGEPSGEKRREARKQAEDAAKAEGCPVDPAVTRALDALAQVSLNTIHVVVDGVMSIDTATLQARIENVTIDKDTDPETWKVSDNSTKTTITGTITGSYLTGGTPVIQEAKADNIKSVKIVTEGSNDQALKFSLHLGQALKPGDHLTFVVEKATKDSKAAPVDSTPFLYVVPPATAQSKATEEPPKQR